MKILSVLKTKMKLAFLQYFKNTERNVFTSTMDIYSSHSNFQCIGGKSTFCEKISSLICSEVSIAFGFKLLTANKPEKYLEHDTDKLGSR